MSKSECTFDKIVDTQELQELSVVNYMAASGYEPVYGDKGLCSFLQPKFACIGKQRVSFNSAVRMHNTQPNEVFKKITADSGQWQSFEDFLLTNENDLTVLFAGQSKIVKKAKLTYSRKEGVKVQSHKVEFLTRRDFKHYGPVLGLE